MRDDNAEIDLNGIIDFNSKAKLNPPSVKDDHEVENDDNNDAEGQIRLVYGM